MLPTATIGGKLVRPERFELPTYCSGVILGGVAPLGFGLHAAANIEIHVSNLQLYLTPSKQVVATVSATVVPAPDSRWQVFSSRG